MAHRQKTNPGRLFRLMRAQDPTQVAGTGHVASGVHWPDGSVTLKWHSPATSASVANVSHYGNVSLMLSIHGHGGRTRMEYVRDEPGTAVQLLGELSDFTFYLGDFVERVEKGLNPPADQIRRMFGRLLDVATEAQAKT